MRGHFYERLDENRIVPRYNDTYWRGALRKIRDFIILRNAE